MLLGRMLLQKWLKDDPEQAIKAIISSSNLQELSQTMHNVILTHPELVKKWINDHTFGIHTSILFKLHIDRQISQNPHNLLEEIDPERPASSRQIIDALAKSGKLAGDPAFLDAILERALGIPDSLVTQALSGLFSGLPSEELLSRFKASNDPRLRDFFEHSLLQSMQQKTTEDIVGIYNRLSGEERLRFAHETARLPKPSAAGLMAAIDETVHLPDWQQHSKSFAVALHNHGRSHDQREAILDWALSLPERDDTLDLFRVAIRGLTSEHPEQARHWIESLEQGWKKQNALTAYFQSSVNLQRGEEDMNWALSRISDPKFQKQAEQIQSDSRKLLAK